MFWWQHHSQSFPHLGYRTLQMTGNSHEWTGLGFHHTDWTQMYWYIHYHWKMAKWHGSNKSKGFVRTVSVQSDIFSLEHNVQYYTSATIICSKNIDNTIIINNVKQHNKLNNSNNDSFQLRTVYTILYARFI